MEKMSSILKHHNTKYLSNLTIVHYTKTSWNVRKPWNKNLHKLKQLQKKTMANYIEENGLLLYIIMIKTYYSLSKNHIYR